jgi:hypothetical protein
LSNKNAGELTEMMRDKIQELIDSEDDGISVGEASELITEAILIGAVILSAVREQPISIVLGSIAGIAFNAELTSEVAAAMERANIARNN